MVDAALRVQLRQQRPIPLHVDLHCPPGEVLALVGPSGGGKSTVLRAIAGLDRAAQGTVRCGDEQWLDSAANLCRSPQMRRVGLVFQQYALFPHLSALANVAEAVPRDHPDRLARAKAWLARVNLVGMDERRPHELSGGQQQRVAVARALAREPAVLLLDEPFSALDELTRRHLHAELALLRRSLAMPTVLVTHDLDEAALLCDRMAVLADGRILQTGTPAQVLQQPTTPRVARLVGMHNVFAGEVAGHDTHHTALRWQGVRLLAPLAPRHRPGSRVSWAIPAEQVLLPARPGLPALPGDAEVEVMVTGVTALRQSLQIRLRTLGPEPLVLVMQAPPLHAARHGIAPGAVPSEPLHVRLRGSSIVVMDEDAQPG